MVLLKLAVLLLHVCRAIDVEIFRFRRSWNSKRIDCKCWASSSLRFLIGSNLCTSHFSFRFFFFFASTRSEIWEILNYKRKLNSMAFRRSWRSLPSKSFWWKEWLAWCSWVLCRFPRLVIISGFIFFQKRRNKEIHLSVHADFRRINFPFRLFSDTLRMMRSIVIKCHHGIIIFLLFLINWFKGLPFS